MECCLFSPMTSLLCAGQYNQWISTITAVATSVIALVNIGLTIYIYTQNRKDSSIIENCKRRFELMQILILNHNMNKLYDFYDEITAECLRLQNTSEDQGKKDINSVLLEKAKRFRHNFISLFNVIDPQLYKSLLSIIDNLVDNITNAIFDDGINLKHAPKYDEVISQRISKNRVDFLSTIYGMEQLEVNRYAKNRTQSKK